LFRSALFWLGLPITILLALLPRYLYLAWSFGFNPNDLDILNWNYKIRPDMDLIHEAYLNSGEHVEERVLESAAPRSDSPTAFVDLGRPSMQGQQGSHIDMSTGQRSQSRGYSFAQEENGVAMRRMQSNLSGALPDTPARRGRGTALLRSIRHPLRRKQPPGEPSS
jgi:phospholipid-translocating ATPase